MFDTHVDPVMTGLQAIWAGCMMQHMKEAQCARECNSVLQCYRVHHKVQCSTCDTPLNSVYIESLKLLKVNRKKNSLRFNIVLLTINCGMYIHLSCNIIPLNRIQHCSVNTKTVGCILRFKIVLLIVNSKMHSHLFC